NQPFGEGDQDVWAPPLPGMHSAKQQHTGYVRVAAADADRTARATLPGLVRQVDDAYRAGVLCREFVDAVFDLVYREVAAGGPPRPAGRRGQRDRSPSPPRPCTDLWRARHRGWSRRHIFDVLDIEASLGQPGEVVGFAEGLYSISIAAQVAKRLAHDLHSVGAHEVRHRSAAPTGDVDTLHCWPPPCVLSCAILLALGRWVLSSGLLEFRRGSAPPFARLVRTQPDHGV